MAICCASFCKIFHRARKERVQRLAAENLARDLSTSVYVIPISLSDDDVHRPPRYSTAQFYDPPPAYNQVTPFTSRLCIWNKMLFFLNVGCLVFLQVKSEAYPLEAPPSYTEAVSDSPAHSWNKTLPLTFRLYIDKYSKFFLLALADVQYSERLPLER